MDAAPDQTLATRDANTDVPRGEQGRLSLLVTVFGNSWAQGRRQRGQHLGSPSGASCGLSSIESCMPVAEIQRKRQFIWEQNPCEIQANEE